MDILLKSTPSHLSQSHKPINKSQNNKSPKKGIEAEISKIKKSLGKELLSRIENNKVSLWQVSLQKEIHINDLKICFPDNKNHTTKDGSIPNMPPKGAPKWAGGEGMKFPKKEVKTWSQEEIKNLITLFNSGLLLPWEASILYSQNARRIIKLLLSNGIDSGAIQESPTCIPAWSQYKKFGAKRVKVFKSNQGPKQILPPQNNQINSFDLTNGNNSPFNEKKILKHHIKTSKWTLKDKENLAHYWKLELLGSDEIAALMERCPNKTITMAKELGLPKKHRISCEEWCGIRWQFTPEGEGDPRHLNPNLQRLVAEASATRFSLLYEIAQSIKETDSKYRKIQRELNQILELHSRIFSKYLLTRSRKYKFLGTSAWQVQKDLEQAGQTAIFECLRRWHPNRNIRFSRGTVNIAINREMLAWLEQQRLVELPDKIRSVARKLKQAHDRGTWEKEVDRLKKEAGENCVREASKHQNTYAYLHTVPLMESYDETEAEHGGITAGSADCIENFSAVCMPQSDTDVCGLLIDACTQIPLAEKRAVLAYHGINEDGTHGPQQTLEEIGAREGVTKERIRQRILKAKQRMRRWLERKNIKNVHDALSHT